MIRNINKPTKPFWNKVILASAATSAFLASASYLYHIQWLMILAGVLGIVGTVGPIFMPADDNKGEQA